jgi:hypothetical protein
MQSTSSTVRPVILNVVAASGAIGLHDTICSSTRRPPGSFRTRARANTDTVKRGNAKHFVFPRAILTDGYPPLGTGSPGS